MTNPNNRASDKAGPADEQVALVLHLDVDLCVRIHELIEALGNARHQAIAFRRLYPVQMHRHTAQGRANVLDGAILLLGQVEPMMVGQHAVEDRMSSGGMRPFIESERLAKLRQMALEAGAQVPCLRSSALIRCVQRQLDIVRLAPHVGRRDDGRNSNAFVSVDIAVDPGEIKEQRRQA
jgi:hypothetical protein